MSDDRLEEALHAMKTEDADAGTIEVARARVWDKLKKSGSALCAEFRQDFGAYLGKELGAWPTAVAGRPSESLRQLSNTDHGDEGRANSHRHATPHAQP